MSYYLGTIPSNADRNIIQYRSQEYEMVSSAEEPFRCVLYRNGRAKSLAPPKAYPIHKFEDEYPFSECFVEDWIVGDMVNLFFDGEWEICTLDGVGGNHMTEASDTKTIRQRFFDACSTGLLELTSLDVRKCYSFVVNSDLWLVSCYEINSENVAKSVDSYGEFRGTKVRRPEHSVASTFEEVRQRFASHNCDANSAGVMIYHVPTGKRTKMRNPVHELAGIDIKVQHRFFYMRSQNRISEYLTYFPEHTDVFETLENHVSRFTTQLHQNYIDCYVDKNVPPPLTHRIHLYSLHQMYLRELRPSPVTLHIVTQYVNELNPAKLFYTMNPQISRQK